MKVAYSLTQVAHNVPGGTAVVARELRSALLDRDDAPEVVSVGCKGARWLSNEKLPEPSARYRMPYPALYELWNKTDRGSMERLVPDADVIHMTMAFCAARRSAPQVCTIHDMFPFTHPELFTTRGARVMEAGMARVIQRADVITASLQATADQLVSYGADAAKVRVVPFGAAPQEFTSDEIESVRNRFRLPERFVMFAGTMEPRKNLEVLLDAMEFAGPEVVLAIVGPSGWGEIGERVQRSSSDRIRVLGWQSRSDLLALMTAASAVCMPSLAEGFGLPAMEAMAQGTPVVHSECSALTEVVGGTGSSVHSADVKGWADEITAFVTNTERSDELGHAAKERAKLYTWDRTASLMQQVYEEVA